MARSLPRPLGARRPSRWSTGAGRHGGVPRPGGRRVGVGGPVPGGAAARSGPRGPSVRGPAVASPGPGRRRAGPAGGRPTSPNNALERTGHSPRFVARRVSVAVARRSPRALGARRPSRWPTGAGRHDGVPRPGGRRVGVGGPVPGGSSARSGPRGPRVRGPAVASRGPGRRRAGPAGGPRAGVPPHLTTHWSGRATADVLCPAGVSALWPAAHRER